MNRFCEKCAGATVLRLVEDSVFNCCVVCDTEQLVPKGSTLFSWDYTNRRDGELLRSFPDIQCTPFQRKELECSSCKITTPHALVRTAPNKRDHWSICMHCQRLYEHRQSLKSKNPLSET